MSESGIDRLLEERSLLRETFTDPQIIGFWDKAATSLADARSGAISTEGAFQLTYTAALQASLAVLAAHGLRVRSVANHYLTFHTVEKLDPALRVHGQRLNGLRAARHQTIYEPEHDEAHIANQLAGAFERLREALPVFRRAILAVRPTLASSLRVLQP